MKTLTDTINTYFAVLIITVVGAGAALIIEHVAQKSGLSLEATAGSSVDLTWVPAD